MSAVRRTSQDAAGGRFRAARRGAPGVSATKGALAPGRGATLPRADLRWTQTAPPFGHALAAACALALGAPAAWADELPPAWSVAPVTLFEARTYTEGPVFDAGGTLFFSEPATGVVTRLGADGREEAFAERRPGANGHAVLRDGTHVVLSRPDVLWLDGEGAVLHVVSTFEGEAFAFPNDLALDGEGGFWFTDSGSRTEATGAIHHMDAHRRVRRLAEGLAFPNGIVAYDGRLYVSQSQANDVLVFDVGPGGVLSGRRVLLALPAEGLDDAKAAPDGMCLGPGGTLFVAHNGTGRLRAVDPDTGALLASYRTGLLTNSNCAVGPDGALYVTGSLGLETGPGALARLDLGMASPAFHDTGEE